MLIGLVAAFNIYSVTHSAFDSSGPYSCCARSASTWNWVEFRGQIGSRPRNSYLNSNAYARMIFDSNVFPLIDCTPDNFSSDSGSLKSSELYII